MLVIQTGSSVNIKPQSLTCDFSVISAWIFIYVAKTSRRTVKRPF